VTHAGHDGMLQRCRTGRFPAHGLAVVMSMVTANLSGSSLDVDFMVRPVRRALARDLMLRSSARALLAFLLGVAVIVAVARLSPWQPPLPGTPLGWTLAYLAAVVVCTAAKVASTWPSAISAIRRTDQVFCLKDRLITAYEFRGATSEIHELQRAEAQRCLGGTNLAEAARMRLPLIEATLVVISGLLVAGAFWLPNTHATSHDASADTSAIRHAAATTSQVLKNLPRPAGQKAGPSEAPTADPVAQILAGLQKQLASAPSTTAALKSLSSAQSQLQNLQASGQAASAALQAMSQALSSGPTKPLAQALQSGNIAATQKAAQGLASQLAKMSAAQRADVASALERAANNAPSSLTQDLRQAAFSLSDDDLRAASQALASAAKQLAQQETQANSRAEASRIASQVQQIQSDLANSVTASPSNNDNKALSTPQNQPAVAQSAGTPGAGPTQIGQAGQQAQAAGTETNGQQSAAVASAASAQGTAGASAATSNGATGASASSKAGASSPSSASQSRGSSAVPGAGAGKSNANQNGRGSGATGSSGSGEKGQQQTVFVPSTRLSGPGVTQTGPLGSVVAVGSPAYKQLIARYGAAATAGLGNIALPPSLQAAVKRYFNDLQR